MNDTVSKSRTPAYHLKCGVAYMLFASFCFTSITALSQVATKEVSIATVIFFQHFIAWFSILPWFYKHGFSLLRLKNKGLFMIRCIGVVAFGFVFLAAKSISLVDAILLNNASPFIIPIVSWIWLKVPINHKIWIGITAGFIGVVLILRPSHHIANYGAIFALLSATINAFVMIALRLLSVSERSHTVLFYYFLTASSFVFPLMWFNWTPPSLRTWIILGMIGVFSSLGQWGFIRAFYHAKPTQLSSFVYAGVVYAAIFDWAFYRIIPDFLTFIGMILVCLGGIWSIRFSQNTILKKADVQDS